MFAQQGLQEKINAGEEIIEQYYQQKQDRKREEVSIEDVVIPRVMETNQQSRKQVYIALEKLYKKEMDLIAQQLKNVQKSGFDEQIAEELKRIEKEELLLEKELLTIQDIGNTTTLANQYQQVVDDIQTISNKLEGENIFTYNGSKYTAFVVDLNKSDINLYTHGTMRNELKRLRFQNKQVEMITNGGMFHQNRHAVGLLICNQNEIDRLNENVNKAEKSNKSGNFHLEPNGVFYVDQTGAFIKETTTFSKKYHLKIIEPIHATQSGPMLIINGKHHPKFNHGSSNVSLRSGVGVMPNNKLVFIVSHAENTNFFQFATLFKDLFACHNALFLDGKISDMYTPLKRHALSNSHVYGPIISVTKK